MTEPINMKWLTTNFRANKQGRVKLLVILMACSLHIQAQNNLETTDSAIVTTAINDSLMKEVSPLNNTESLSRYEKHRERIMKRWKRLIPTQASLQYAGSIGIMSAGWGWHYGKGFHWETDMLIGIVPRYHTEKFHSSFTIKQRYIPWHCTMSHRWTIEPFTAGVFFNTITGDDFWRSLPDKYPKHYYWFSTKIRANIFIGQRLRFNIPRNKRFIHQAISFYYEFSSCDLYIVSKATNKHYPWRETLSLALGLRWEM